MITTAATPGAERRLEPLDRRDAQRLQIQYETLIGHLDHAFVWEADADTRRISYVSAQLERLLGYSLPQGLAGPEGWIAHVPSEDRESLRQAFHRARAEPGNQRCEHRCRAADGSVRWLQTSIQLVALEGDPPHFQGVSFDITPARAAQDQLAEQHSERAHVQDADRFLLGASATLSVSLESTAVVNAAARLGVPLLGELCLVDVVAPDDQPRLVAWAHADPAVQGELDRELGANPRGPIFPALVAEVLAIGRSLTIPIEPDAWRSLEDVSVIRRLELRSARCVPLTLGARRLGALTFCVTGARHHHAGDVTLAEKLGRRSALAIEHARLYAQARQAVALREQTLAIVSHDLRSPLATIVMAASILSDDEIARVNPRAKFLAVDKIQIAAARMERMIGDLLDFASIEAGRLSIEIKPNEIAGIIEEATASFEAMAKKRHLKLTGVAFPPLPLIPCDRDRILQVISNLLSNALKIVPAGGSVSLRVKLDGNAAVFSVSDTGPGIAFDNQKRLFERYWRSGDASYKGTGLGLAIARGIVEAHRGRLWVESEFGHGATFHFTVPLAEPSPTASRPQLYP